MDRKTYNDLTRTFREFIDKCREIEKKVGRSSFGLICAVTYPRVGSEDNHEARCQMLGNPVSCGVVVNMALTIFKKALKDIPPKDRNEIIEAIKEVSVGDIKIIKNT